MASGQLCSQGSNKWKSNDTQSASHRLCVRSPSKVTLDEVQPLARCLFSTKSNFFTLYISVLGWSSHQERVSLCCVRVRTESNCSVCNFSWAWWTNLHSLAFTFLLWEMCSLALKEKCQPISTPRFRSVQFRYPQLSKHAERLDIRNPHLSPRTHKPSSFGWFSIFVQDDLFTVLLCQQATL